MDNVAAERTAVAGCSLPESAFDRAQLIMTIVERGVIRVGHCQCATDHNDV